MTRQPKNILAELPSPEVIDVPALASSLADGSIDLVVVLGPTASGKTKYAVRLAGELACLLGSAGGGVPSRSFPQAGPFPFREPMSSGGTATRGASDPSGMTAEIISADSRQVFRGMDIGTGKDLSEYGEVPYHLIDILPAGEQYNVHRFQEDFSRAWLDIRSRGAVPILCGGTGLYINSVLNGYDFENRRPLSELRSDRQNQDIGAGSVALPRNAFVIGTLVSREVRNARIDARLDARLAEGMVEEIRSLLDGTSPGCGNGPVPPEVLLSYGLEYKFVTQYLLGEISFDQMRTLLATAIHQFAKRQMTWFRGMERSGIRIHWTEV